MICEAEVALQPALLKVDFLVPDGPEAKRISMRLPAVPTQGSEVVIEDQRFVVARPIEWVLGEGTFVPFTVRVLVHLLPISM